MSAVPTSPYLDVRNLMWLLIAMVFVVAPHVPRLPYWIVIFSAIVVAWRAWIAWAAWHFPMRWITVGLTVAASVGILATYRTLAGREAGVALLIVMAALKLLEMRTQREVVLSIYLGFFLVMTNFLFSQTIPLGIYMLACVWFFVAALVGFNRVGRTPTLVERLRPAGVLLVQALPLMAAFFLLFPRGGPLWALPRDTAAGRTGLSETMTPGTLANLIKSDEVALRVQFPDGLPPNASLYWRGPVMTRFDGRSWTMEEFPPIEGPPVYASHGKLTPYTVTLEPHSKTWLFALDVPAELPPGSVALPDLQLRSRVPVAQRLRYDMASWLEYRYGERPPNYQLRQALGYDRTHNPRTIELAQRWAAETRDPRLLVNRALQYFQSQFVYTLEPPTLDPNDPYDDFLFNTKRGFCEHYAGSFALIMRAAGIPARVVTGYQGGEVNPLNKELIVRQADAHAWTEVWFPGEGWKRIDPTAAVSPIRVESGVNAALGPIGVIPSLIAADQFGLLARLRYTWQAVNSQWDQWIVGYNVDRQRQFFQNLGIPTVDWQTLGAWLVVVTFVIGAAISLGLLVRDRPRRREPAVIAWQRYCAKLATAGVARAPHEGPLDFLARVRSAKPQLAHDAEEITRRYVEARYGAGATREELRELARRVRELRPA